MKSVCCARSFPPYLFGTWKLGLYEVKLEWGAFRRHLGDLAQLEVRYGGLCYVGNVADIWDGAWGWGPVEQAMKELRMSAEIVQIYPLCAHVSLNLVLSAEDYREVPEGNS